MQSTSDGSTLSLTTNAFDADFLHELARRGEVPTAPEAELAGPWKVCRLPGDRHGVFRAWEVPDGGADGDCKDRGSEDDGDVPEAVFEQREHALLAAAVLPALGREPLFQLSPADRPEGYSVESVWGDRWVATVGRLRRFQPDLVDALHIAESVVRSPTALACLLEAAGHTALELVGRILHRQMAEAAED